MIDFDHASALAVSILGFGGGALAYFGSRHAKKGEASASDKEINLTFIQEQFVKIEGERDNANRDREEVSAKAFENIITLLDIVRRLCYMLAISDSSRAEINKREIMTVIKFREFDAKDTLLAELAEIFGLSASEIAPPPGGFLPSPTGSITEQERE